MGTKKSVSGSTYYKSSNVSGPGSTEYKDSGTVFSIGERSSIPKNVYARVPRAPTRKTMPTADVIRSSYYMSNPTQPGAFNTYRAGTKKSVPAMPAPTGDARITPQKTKAPSVVRATTNMKTSPVKAQSAKPSFKGNWKNAAPTAMQARGGARIDRGGGLFGSMGFGGKSTGKSGGGKKK